MAHPLSLIAPKWPKVTVIVTLHIDSLGLEDEKKLFNCTPWSQLGASCLANLNCARTTSLLSKTPDDFDSDDEGTVLRKRVVVPNQDTFKTTLRFIKLWARSRV